MPKELPDDAPGENPADEISEKVWLYMAAFLRDIRISRKISLRELSSKIGVHSSHLARVEKGDTLPNVILVLRWAGALRVDFGRLYESTLRLGDEKIG